MDEGTMVALEEFAELVEETQTQLADETKAGNDTIALVTALECLCDQIEAKETMTTSDIEMVNTAGMFAAAATGTEIGVVVPALEEGTTPAIALEGVMEKIHNGLTSLAQSSDVVMNLISKRLAGLGTLIKTYETRHESLHEALRNYKDRTGKSLDVKFTVFRGDEVPAKIDDYIKRITQDVDTLEQMLGTFIVEGPSLQKSIVKTIKSFVDGKYGETMAETFNFFNEDVLGKMSGRFMTQKSMGPQVRATSSPLLGDVNFYIRRSKVAMAADDDRDMVRGKINILRFVVQHPSERTMGREREHVTYENVKVQDVLELHAQMGRLIKVLKDYHDIGAHHYEDWRKAYSIVNIAFNTGRGAGIGGKVFYELTKMPGLLDHLKKMVPPPMATTIGATATGVVAGAAVGYAAAQVSEWLRRAALAWIFSTMKLQYKVTEFMGWVDSGVVKIAIENVGRGFVVIHRYTK